MKRETKAINLFKAEKEELKPCPFCGGEEIYYRAYEHLAGKRWKIICVTCMATIDPGTIQDRWRLKEMWNRRTEGENDNR